MEIHYQVLLCTRSPNCQNVQTNTLTCQGTHTFIWYFTVFHQGHELISSAVLNWNTHLPWNEKCSMRCGPNCCDHLAKFPLTFDINMSEEFSISVPCCSFCYVSCLPILTAWGHPWRTSLVLMSPEPHQLCCSNSSCTHSLEVCDTADCQQVPTQTACTSPKSYLMCWRPAKHALGTPFLLKKTQERSCFALLGFMR